MGNESEAAKIKAEREAEGQSQAITLMANAQANAIETIANELNKPGGTEAAQLALARDYVQMYGEMGSRSNTMFFNQNAGDVTSLLVQAAAAMKTTSDNKK